jgi:hypothetical protein
MPCTPLVDCAHLFVACVNSSVDYDNTSANNIDFSIDCGNKSNNYMNTPNDWANTIADLVDTSNISSSKIWTQILHLCSYWSQIYYSFVDQESTLCSP